ncbi:MAG: hypothetical protein ABII12_04890 [Planctomycetota bacterium]
MRTATGLITSVAAICLAIGTPVRGDFIACEQTLWYLIHEEPTDPESDVVFIVRLQVEAEDSDVDAIGWRIVAAEFRQPDGGGGDDTVWLDGSPVVDSPDGLWWCDHADFLAPQLNEFAMPPLLEGTADAQDSQGPDLDYSFEGVLYEPPPGGPPYDPTAAFNYVFTRVGEQEPKEEGDDEPGEIDEENEPPLGGSIRGGGPVNGLDIQTFVEAVINEEVDINETPCFIVALLGGECECPRPGVYDCNANSIIDEIDIFLGTSADCNGNGVPDECEIDEDSQAPGGPFYCTEDCDPDCNANGIPDACEEDCNANGVPDDCDIAAETSTDVNGNSIPDDCEPDCNNNDVPDAWDILQETSADCNENGWPDECEPDCNANGVPDDCDLDPSDPDGDEFVSEDCNGNDYPDECDLTLPPPFGSLDCNDNDIPDECDLADCEGEAWCDDCNENGFLDVCDIAAEISDDANENGVPDECEGEGLLGGGDAPTGDGDPTGDGLSADEAEAAWAEFVDWSMQRTWGPDADCGGGEQFQSLVDELEALELPVRSPSLVPPA